MLAREAGRDRLLTWQIFEVPAAPNNTLNQHIVTVDAVEHQVLADGKRAQARPQVIAASARLRILPDQQEPVVDGFEEAVGGLETAAFTDD